MAAWVRINLPRSLLADIDCCMVECVKIVRLHFRKPYGARPLCPPSPGSALADNGGGGHGTSLLSYVAGNLFAHKNPFFLQSGAIN